MPIRPNSNFLILAQGSFIIQKIRIENSVFQILFSQCRFALFHTQLKKLQSGFSLPMDNFSLKTLLLALKNNLQALMNMISNPLTTS